jgi:hypothetical protein
MKTPVTALRLSPAQIAKLNSIATAHGTLSRTGPTSGLPSWRVLVADIADGRLTVKDPAKRWEPKEPKEKKKRKPFRAHPRFAAKWWKPTEMDDMPVADALAASGYPLDELVAAGMKLVDDGANLITPPEWTGWAWKEEEG